MAAEAPCGTRLRESVERSRAVRSLRRTVAAVGNSRLARASAWFGHATRHSFLHRWLTEEPEPDVIVIDLRETYTVGPVVEIIDRSVTTFAPIWRTSWLKRSTDILVRLLDIAAESYTGQTIVKLLEPPESGEGENR